MIFPTAVLLLAGLCAASNSKLSGYEHSSACSSSSDDKAASIDSGESCHDSVVRQDRELSPRNVSIGALLKAKNTTQNLTATSSGMNSEHANLIATKPFLRSRKFVKVNKDASKRAAQMHGMTSKNAASDAGTSTVNNGSDSDVETGPVEHEIPDLSNYPFLSAYQPSTGTSAMQLLMNDQFQHTGHLLSSTSAINSSSNAATLPQSVPVYDSAETQTCSDIFCGNPYHYHKWQQMKDESDGAYQKTRLDMASQGSNMRMPVKRSKSSSESSGTCSTDTDEEEAQMRTFGRRVTVEEIRALPDDEWDRLDNMRGIVYQEWELQVALRRAEIIALKLDEKRQKASLPPYMPRVDPRNIYGFLSNIPEVGEAIAESRVEFIPSRKQQREERLLKKQRGSSGSNND